jgi:hypothetical protein
MNWAQALFVGGLTLDIVGAFVLARGFIVQDLDKLTLEGTSGFGSPPNIRYIASAVAQKADAEVGFWVLALGFLTQALDYIFFDQNAPGKLATIDVAAGAAGLAIIASGVAQEARSALLARHARMMVTHVLRQSSNDDTEWVRAVIRHLAPRDMQRARVETDEAFLRRIQNKYLGETPWLIR